LRTAVSSIFSHFLVLVFRNLNLVPLHRFAPLDYPDKIVKLSREELEDAIAISQEFRTFAIEQIGIEEINTGS